MLGTRTAHLIILCIRVIKKICGCSGMSTVPLLWYCTCFTIVSSLRCYEKRHNAKFCITATLYEFRFPPTISSIWLVTAIHSLWLRMVAVNPSTVWNLKGKNAFLSLSCFSLKYFQPQNLIGDTVSPYYTDYILNDQTIKTVCPVPFNLNMLFCGINKFGQLPVLNPVIK